MKKKGKEERRSGEKVDFGLIFGGRVLLCDEGKRLMLNYAEKILKIISKDIDMCSYGWYNTVETDNTVNTDFERGGKKDAIFGQAGRLY